MSLFTAKGKDAKKSANQKKVDLKKVYIRLKDGESVRVRLLGTTDYVEYKAQGDFNLGIFTTPDIEPMTGKPSPYTVASNSGIEKFSSLYPKKRYLFAFADIDTGEIRVWDASKTQGSSMMDLIEEYAESVDEVAFTLKRTGTKVETSYNLIPIMKLKADDKEKFHKFDGAEVPEDLFESVLIPRTEAQMIEALAQAGFPTDDFFGTEASANEGTDDSTNEGTDENIGTDETENF